MENRDKDLESPILFFDGVCNFCNSTVDWVWKRNKKQNLKFSSLQSEFAQDFLKQNNLETFDFSTLYFSQGGKIYKRSQAVFRIMRHFSGGWRILGSFLSIFPTFLTDPFYKLIANNRYKLYGKRDTCRLPTPEERDRFLE